jgi:hypothetical protein
MDDVDFWQCALEKPVRVSQRLDIKDRIDDLTSTVIFMVSDTPDLPFRFNLICLDSAGTLSSALLGRLASLEVLGRNIMIVGDHTLAETQESLRFQPYTLTKLPKILFHPSTLTRFMSHGPFLLVNFSTDLSEENPNFSECIKTVATSSNFRGCLSVDPRVYGLVSFLG